MAKTLKQLREDVATRLGFAVINGAELIQAAMLDRILQDSQTSILEEFGTQLPGNTIPSTPFEADDDLPSVPERPLLLKAMLAGRIHYRQPADYESSEWQNWENGVRGFVR